MNAQPAPPRVLLVSMPWASTCRPSLGVGTLVAVAQARGFECRSAYPNLLFSSLLGAELYEYFADTPPLFALAEHLFAVDVFGREALDSDAYLDRLAGALMTDPASGANPLLRLRDELCPTFLDRCVAGLLGEGADVIGFSCTFNQVLPSLAAARRIKAARPEVRILFGGACVHDRMGEAYARAFPDYIDHVFTGEADSTFASYLTALGTGSEVADIPGVTCGGKLRRKAAIVPALDDVPAPNYDDYFSERALLLESGHRLEETKNLPFESSRGCWWGETHHCTFCGLNNAGMKYRSKSAAKVVSEILTLSRRYRSVNFMAADNILDFSGYAELLPEIGRLPVDLKLFYEIKANVKRGDVAAMARARVGWVQPGIESFSDHVLKLMRKGTSALQNVQAIKWLHEYGIAPSYNILVGFPGERDEDYEEMLRVIRALSHLPPPSGLATPVQVHRFSPFYFEPGEHGIRNLRAEDYYRHLIPPSILPPEDFAYFFKHDLPEDAPVFRHLGELNEAIRAWRDSDRRVAARLGAGFVEVEVTEGGVGRTQTLDLLASLVLLLADQQTSFAGIARQVEALLPSERAGLGAAVEMLTDFGFLLANSDRVVSVVPFDNPHPAEDFENWMKLWAGPAREEEETPAAASEPPRWNVGATRRSLPVLT